jgi:hypothetical protein
VLPQCERFSAKSQLEASGKLYCTGNIDRAIIKVVKSWSEDLRKSLVSCFNGTGPLVSFVCLRGVLPF